MIILSIGTCDAIESEQRVYKMLKTFANFNSPKFFCMKNVTRFFTLSFVLIASISVAQDNMGIGTIAPDPSAVLDLTANDKGLLVPRMTTAQRTSIASPATGLLVYDTTDDTFWYFDGTQWVQAIGPTGPQGPTGADGATGAQGPQGPAGATGPQGATGANGATGLQGPQGPQGLSGADGAPGSTGPQGPTGATGTTGPQGLAGPTGAQGITGPQGPAGATGPQGVTGAAGPVGCTTTDALIKSDGSSAICSQVYDDGTNVGVGTPNPFTKLHVDGDIRLGLIYNGPSGTLPGYGNFFIFSGGPSVTGSDSENTDYFNMARYNIAADVSDLRMTIGDNNTLANADYFSVGTVGSAYDLFAVRSDGNVGIGTRDADSKLDVHGKLTVSRDGDIECCGNNATISIAETTSSSGNRASISFHNAGTAEGTLELVQDAVPSINTTSRRLRLYDNQAQGLGLELSGGLFYGTSNSRTQTRDDAGLQGNAGAQSGFFETSAPVNYPTGATSWWHLLDVRHSNPSNNFAMQFSGSFFDQKLFMRKTNTSAGTAWNRIVNSADAAATSGYLMSDVAGVNGTKEGSITVNIVNGLLTVTGFDEGGANLGTWYSIGGVANAKIVVQIINDDTGNCGGTSAISSFRTFVISNNGGAQSQATDIGCTGSDGNHMLFNIVFNPL
ncbi:MAG: collagen-like protein [Flavobacteriales bacterium]|nr:collagen-like protein [Flavobacteriales bacterium]